MTNNEKILKDNYIYDKPLTKYTSDGLVKNELLEQAFIDVINFLNDKQLIGSRYTKLDDYQIDVHPGATWFRIYFHNRLTYLSVIDDLIEIINNIESVGICVKETNIFVSNSITKCNNQIKNYLSETIDPLYDKCLFDFFRKEKTSADRPIPFGSYAKTKIGFDVYLYSKIACKPFNDLCLILIPEYQLNWFKSEDNLYKYRYICQIIMLDKVDPSSTYVSFKEFNKRFPVKKFKHVKPKLTFETYVPTDEEKEVYYNIMNKIKMANS